MTDRPAYMTVQSVVIDYDKDVHGPEKSATWPRKRPEDGKIYVSPQQFVSLRKKLDLAPTSDGETAVREFLNENGWDSRSFEYRPFEVVVDWKNEHE